MTYRAYVVNYRHNWANVDVARCASTSLKMTMFLENCPGATEVLHRHAEETGTEWNPHGIPPSQWVNCGFIVPLNWNLPSGMVRFAVWRDPVERMRSLWKWFCVGDTPSRGNPLVGIVGASWDEFCEYVTWALSLPGIVRETLDHHIAPQSMLYGPEDVDVIVMLADLDKFLLSLGSEPTWKLASSNHGGPHDDYEREQVRAAYIKDYDILNWGKTWKPQQ